MADEEAAYWDEVAKTAPQKRPPKSDKKKSKKKATVKTSSDGLTMSHGDDEKAWKLQVAEEEKADKASHRKARPNRALVPPRFDPR